MAKAESRQEKIIAMKKNLYLRRRTHKEGMYKVGQWTYLLVRGH